MSARNKFLILLGIIFVIAATYYFLSTEHTPDLVLIGTVDANQVIVSAQVEGRIQKLLVDEGTPVKAGDLIAVLDPSELQAQEAASAATIASLQHKVTEMEDTEQSTSGSTSSDVANAEAKLLSARAQLLQAKAALDRTESDSRRAIELAKAGITSDQERVQAETNLQAAQATVQAQQELVRAAQADRGPNAPGECGEEHRGLDRGRSEKCDCAQESGCGPLGLYECVRSGQRNGFRACGAPGRSRQYRSADRHHCRFERYVGTGGDS